MQSHRRKKSAAGSRSRTQQPDHFTPLLAEIRIGLGDRWTFYAECISSVLDAMANQQDTTAWLEQMRQLVQGHDKIKFSHEGILFLLRDMSIQLPQQQSWGEGEGNMLGMYASPPLSPPLADSGGISLSCINDTAPPTGHDQTTMDPPLPHRPVRPAAPVVGEWVAPRSSDPRNQQQKDQQQPQEQYSDPMRGVEPFDFSAPRQPGLTFPKDIRAYHYPPDQIVMTENYVPRPPNPLHQTSRDPIFFEDPALRDGVAEYLAWTPQFHASGRSGSHKNNDWRAHDRLPYEPKDEDLIVWRKKMRNDEEEVKASNQVCNTWPPWDFQLLDFDL